MKNKILTSVISTLLFTGESAFSMDGQEDDLGRMGTVHVPTTGEPEVAKSRVKRKVSKTLPLNRIRKKSGLQSGSKRVKQNNSEFEPYNVPMKIVSPPPCTPEKPRPSSSEWIEEKSTIPGIRKFVLVNDNKDK